MAEPWAALAEDFVRLTSEMICCLLTTVDPRGRPRTRVLHPLWQVQPQGPVGWVITAQTPVKVRHLAANPHVSCAYWSPAQHVVYADCVAGWVTDMAGKQEVWELFATTPPPLGYDPGAVGWGRPDNPLFMPLRLEAWRVQVLRADEYAAGRRVPRLWRAAEPA